MISERFSPEKFLISDIVEEWVRQGHEVRVLTQVPSYPRGRLYPGYANEFTCAMENGARVTRFKTVLGYRESLVRKLLNYLLFMLRASWHCLRESRGVENVFVFQTGPLSQALPLVLLKWLCRKRTSIWTQDVWPDAVFAYGFKDKGSLAVLLKAFVRVVYRSCDEICVSSPGFVDRLGPYLSSAARAVFIPQWVPPDFEKSEPHSFEFKADVTRFIFAGNIGTMQNLRNVILAFGELDADKAEFYILGDGSLAAELKSLVAGRGIANVRFLGRVEPSKVKACIQSCDFAILSLIADPMVSLTIPAKFQAYLSAGRPIVAVTNGEVCSLVRKEGLGLWADPSSVDSIAAALASAIGSSSATRLSWAQNMGRLLSTDFDKGKALGLLGGHVFHERLAVQTRR